MLGWDFFLMYSDLSGAYAGGEGAKLAPESAVSVACFRALT